MSDIFREVDEEVRQDRALAFWTRYQGWFLVLAAVIVVVAGGWRFYVARQEAVAEDAGERYRSAVQASKDGRSADALASLDALAKDGPAGYRQLAALRAADEAWTTDPARARVSFDAIANDAKADPLFRDVARLRGAMLRSDAGETREASLQLEQLATAEGPFRNTARELLAAAAITADNLNGAGQWLDRITQDPAAPSDAKQRARAFLDLVRAGRKPAG